MVSERVESAFGVNALSYVLVVIGFAISFILANDITTKKYLVTHPGVSVYYSLLCITSTIGLIYIDVYLALKRRQRQRQVVITPKDKDNESATETPPDGDVVEGVDGYYTNVTKGINFYFLLGGLLFGIGAIILDIVTLTTVKTGCVNTYRIVFTSTHLILTITEIVFVFRRYKTVIVKGNGFCRFIMVHVVATNISIWILLSVAEAMEFYHIEILKKAAHATPNSTHLLACHIPIRAEASMYLIPCMIEHALFVIPMLHSMYHKMASAQLQAITQPTAFKCHQVWLMIKRVHVGFIVFLVTVVLEIAFFYLVDDIKNERTSQIVYLSTQIALAIVLVTSLAFGFHRFSKLGFNASKPKTFDEHLLFIAMGGYIFFNVCRLLPSVWGMDKGDAVDEVLAVLIFISSSLAVVHGLLQTTFINISLRSYSLTDDQTSQKPGRSVIGFLIVSNLSLWLTVTFEIRKSTVVPMYDMFYGQLPWLMLTFGAIPLVIFYLFHSTVCLSDVWNEAYEKKEEEE